MAHVLVSTTNGLERLHETLKYSFLSKRSSGTLTELVSIITQDFIPSLHKRLVSVQLPVASQLNYALKQLYSLKFQLISSFASVCKQSNASFVCNSVSTGRLKRSSDLLNAYVTTVLLLFAVDDFLKHLDIFWTSILVLFFNHSLKIYRCQ